MTSLRTVGVQAALVSALLFGAGTPLAKLLLGNVSPWLLAGLLYLGSGLGLSAFRLLTRTPPVRLAPADRRPLAVAVTLGGLVAPVLLMVGLTQAAASSAALLLNAEGVFTALIAWFIFKENVDARVALGMAAIVAGAVVLSGLTPPTWSTLWPSLAILGACLAWAIDNNATRMVSLADATWLAAVKGLIAGSVNLTLAVVAGSGWPSLPVSAAAMLVGLAAYGVSLTLFIVALRHLGTARAGAYFSAAPFFGAVLAVALGDRVTPALVAAGLLMAVGVYLHLSERHDHEHDHPALEHAHVHTHDDGHHDHGHAVPTGVGVRHSHPHEHAPLRHRHHHYPDAHHRHPHAAD